MSDDQYGYKAPYEYRPNTDRPADPINARAWEDNRIQESWQALNKMTANSGSSAGYGASAPSGASSVVSLVFCFGVLALLVGGYLVDALSQYRMPKPLAIAGFWATYVISGALAAGFVVGVLDRFSKARLASGTRRRGIVLLGMVFCAVFTWLIEAIFPAIGLAAHVLLTQSSSRQPADFIAAAARLLVEQAPGLALFVTILALGLGKPYRGAGGFLKSAVAGAIGTGCGLATILAVGIWSSR